MNMEEAYTLASAGHRIAHEHFSSNEYLENRFGALVAEDGVPFNEEYVRRYKSNDWNAKGWRLYSEPVKCNVGLEIIKVLNDRRGQLKDDNISVEVDVQISETRTPFNALFKHGTISDAVRSRAIQDELFVAMLIKTGVPQKHAEKASKQLVNWLKLNGYEQVLGFDAVFYHPVTDVLLTFKCRWMPLRTFEQLIKFYE